MRVIKFVAHYLPYLFFLYFILLVIILIVSKMIDEVIGSSIVVLLSERLDFVLFYPQYFVLLYSIFQAIVNHRNVGRKTDISAEERKQWQRFYRVWLIFANAEYYDKFLNEYHSDAFARFTRFIKLKSVSLNSFRCRVMYLKSPCGESVQLAFRQKNMGVSR